MTEPSFAELEAERTGCMRSSAGVVTSGAGR